MKNFIHDGAQYTLRFAEKGGKSREIPVRHDLEQFLLAYVRAGAITEGPLFRTANRKTKTLTKNAMTGIDVCRMMKRRLKAAELPGQFWGHASEREKLHVKSRPRGLAKGLLVGIPQESGDFGGLMALDALAAWSVIEHRCFHPPWPGRRQAPRP